MKGFAPDFLQGKNVIVTGGATGLGRAMSLRFGSLGARVGILSRKKENLEQTIHEMEENGIDSAYSVCDVRDPAQVTEAFNHIEDSIGKCNVLVNNAAGNFISRTEDLSTKAFDTIIGIVLQGTVHCSLDMGKRWIQSGSSGTILNIVTTYAWTGSGYVVPSAVAKSGVLGLTRSLAVEWGPKNIRNVAIAPGPFPTKGAWNNLVPVEAISEAMIHRNPMRRLGDPRELADLAAFLISDLASYINGEVVTIDGGEWLHGAGQFNSLEEFGDSFWDSIRRNR